MNVRVALLGTGNVNRALRALLELRGNSLATERGIRCEIVGTASRRAGWMAGDRACRDISEWLEATRPDLVFEAIPLDAHAGQPALDYLRAILGRGIHAISANKGPVVHGFRELNSLAALHGCAYRFEAAVMDGAPVFSLVRECLPLAGLRAVRGVFTSTASVVLDAVGRGSSVEQGVAEAQQLGIAEADPSYDIDGWDSAMKLCALANALFGADLRATDVERSGIRELRVEDIVAAEREGTPYRLVGDLSRADGMRARVRPVRCGAGDPLGIPRGATLVMHYDAEMFPGGLTVTSRDPDPTTTAYGMLADMLAVLA